MCATEENKPGLSQPFSLNQTGTLLRRHLAHFYAAVDNNQTCVLQIWLALSLRRDNHHQTATAKMAFLIVAAFSSRLSRYTNSDAYYGLRETLNRVIAPVANPPPQFQSVSTKINNPARFRDQKHGRFCDFW